MNRKTEFLLFLNKNKLSKKYLGYCETIEKAFRFKDIDDIIISQKNMAKVRENLKKTITKNENSINQYITGLNCYLKFAFSATSSIPTKHTSSGVFAPYYVARAKGVALTTEVEFTCRILENEYADIIKFSKDLLVQGDFDSIPVIVSDERPMQDSPDGGEKVLGKFFGSTKPYIEIYYRNFNMNDAASIRNCLAHEYLHYLHYIFAKGEYANSKKELKEGLADFFGFLYSIHRHDKDDLSVAKNSYIGWKKLFGTYWPYASALYFFQVGGNEMKYSANYDKYVKHGCIGKFIQIFYNTQHPDRAYHSMLSC